MVRKFLRWSGGILGLIFLALQFHPYGWSHSNPPVREEPKWDSPVTRSLVVRACFDCHSNQTEWPLHSYVAPISWLVRRHVENGRGKLNFSEWDLPQEGSEDPAGEVTEGRMPLPNYVWLHPKAWLTDEERKALIRGLEATFGGEKSDQDREEKEKEEEKSTSG